MNHQLPSTISTVLDVLEWRARVTPGDLAFSIEGPEISYGELQRIVLRACGSLSRLGVRPGDCCGVLLPTSLDFISAVFAVQACAAIPVAFNPNLPKDSVFKLVNVAGCNAVIAHADRLADLDSVPYGTGDPLRLVDVNSILPAEEGTADMTSVLRPEVPARARGEVPAFLQFTSGTTGESRAVIVSHASLLAFLEASRERLEITGSDVLAGYSPLHHNMGLVRYVFGAVCYGCPCYLVRPSIANIPAWMETISRVRATVTSGSDYAYRAAAHLVPPDSVDLSSLRLAISGGEPVRLSTIKLFEERFHVPGIIRPAYGLAEATLGVTSMAAAEALRVDSSGTLSCGRPLQSMQVMVVDGQGQERKPGVEGSILVRGPQLFSGYLGDEEATSQVMRNGWLHTGDWGSRDQDGHVYVLGRREGMIKRGGSTIASRSIEEAAEQIEAFASTAALSLWSTAHDGGDVVIVVAEVKNPHDQNDSALHEMANRLAKSTAAAVGFAPGRILLVLPGTIPRTGSGKIRYGQLREMIVSGDLENRNRILLHRAGD